eukprot:scaffold31536_cov140-Isochrysis_galbana.AAC.3
MAPQKLQYLLYKHALLHGLNASVAASVPAVPPATSPTFRSYWLCLNTSYGMEFFLQTLVKKNKLRQRSMLVLQAVLMAASTAAALQTMNQLTGPEVAALSLALNLGRRGNELTNTALTFGGALLGAEARRRAAVEAWWG